MGYMTISKIQDEYDRGGHASIWTGVQAPSKSEKRKKYYNLRSDDLIMMKFI